MNMFAQGAVTELTNTDIWVINAFFGVIALIAIVAALRMVTTTNVVHAALYLLVVLSAVAAVYVILGAEFVAATQVLVYLGAIMVLLLFGVMLTRAKIGAETDLDHEQRWIGALVAAGMLAVMTFSLWEGFSDEELPASFAPQRTQEVSDEIFSTYIVPFEALSVLLLAALIGAVVVARRD
ncbi:MAG: NADH-quinone oxidoreductase subunit J [Actinomycetia bacterium]|nr:NADH-quinone oxidoreductase subunit J [Actinomycetes bacterium]MCP5032886.1 NADH-quinone oxidoreductase subunit J [Actinomycetes bacterium]